MDIAMYPVASSPTMKTMYHSLLAAIFCASTAAHAQDPMSLYADDGDRITADGAVSFAVVGNSRAGVAADKATGRTGTQDGAAEQIFSDIAQADTDFVVLMGDLVRSGKKGDYKKLSKAIAPLKGHKVVPVAGDHEHRGDATLQQWQAFFPEAGADIGFNRVGSWMWFDIKSEGHIYRFLVLDTNKEALGSRWNEQMTWLPGALEGRFESVFVFLHDPHLELGGREPVMNPGGVPGELLEMIEGDVGLNKIRAIFSAGSHASTVIRPDGPFGTLYVGAGGGGAPAEDLSRWYSAEAAGIDKDVSLEPLYDVSILNALRHWSDDHAVPQSVMDEARADGTYDGFRGVVSGRHMPTHGWFNVSIDGENVNVTFRHRLPDGTIERRYGARYSAESGWIPAP